jgi:eukaryotic-like serine/threonine-protein kinase
MQFETNQDSYKALRAIVSERTTPLIAWVGSGLSAPAGLPTWPGLKASLVAAVQNKASSLLVGDAQKLQREAGAIEQTKDFWVSFERLKVALGETSYREAVREALRPAVTAEAPSLYAHLWRLRVKGVLSLNLDRLATKAFSSSQSRVLPTEFTASQAGPLSHVLRGQRPFILNLHGIAEDSTSWVLTHSELRTLLKDSGYRAFIKACLMSHAVVFVGISADDGAVGGHLELLAKLGVQAGPHYWITDRQDRGTDKWAESIGVRVIRYASAGGDHSALDDLFRDLLSFVPVESAETLPPVILERATTGPERTFSPEALVREDAETIRMFLNEHAKTLLRGSSEEDRKAFAAFVGDYEEAIDRAWFTSTTPGRNTLLGYSLQRKVAEGAFGKVYKASSPDKRTVAIKVLRKEIHDQADLLHCFRRGVRSMRILNDHGLEGMVPYKEASEIPAFVVMDWMEGPDLAAAVEAGHVGDWPSILRIGRDLSRIIQDAHLLPERVLHRDLRPSNVMLSEFYTRPDEWKVVVLDFDLSWHRGAQERSVVHGSTKWGYLAPEQLESISGVSTRHSAVDSFGLGMTLSFLISARDPVPNQHRHVSWQQDVHEAAKRRPFAAWRSIPERFARLVIGATNDAQASRWDLTQINGELGRLLEAATSPGRVRAADLIAEEIVARTTFARDHEYAWNPATYEAASQSPTGLRLSVLPDEAVGRVLVQISLSETGLHEWKRVGKWMASAAHAAGEVLRQSQVWKLETSSTRAHAVLVSASATASAIAGGMDQAAQALDKSLQQLRSR